MRRVASVSFLIDTQRLPSPAIHHLSLFTMTKTAHPISHQSPAHYSSPYSWQSKGLVIKLGAAFIALQVLFIESMYYFYLSVFRAGRRYQAFNILMVDFGSRLIGQSMFKTYEKLQGTAFPEVLDRRVWTPDSLNLSSIPSVELFLGTIHATLGASDRLSDLLQGRSNSAYNTSNAIIYIRDEASYSLSQA